MCAHHWVDIKFTLFAAGGHGGADQCRVMSSKLVLWITILLLIGILGMVIFLKLR